MAGTRGVVSRCQEIQYLASYRIPGSYILSDSDFVGLRTSFLALRTTNLRPARRGTHGDSAFFSTKILFHTDDRT